MTKDSSATAREPHATRTTRTATVMDALKRRARAVLNDTSIDARSRAIIRYGMETNDPWLAELVRRADEDERILGAVDFSQPPESNEQEANAENLEALAEIICRAGDESAAALFVLMGKVENSTHSKVLANTVKHFAFTRCADVDLYGMVEDQIAVLEGKLMACTLVS